MELTELKYRILDRLFFPEPFATLQEEVEASDAILGADLRWLISQQCVQVLRRTPGTEDWETTALLEDLFTCRFQITVRGLKHYQAYRKKWSVG